MDDSCLTPQEKEMLKDPTISDQEKYEIIDQAIWRMALD